MLLQFAEPIFTAKRVKPMPQNHSEGTIFMSNYRHWTPEEEQYIRDHWQTQTEAEMAAALDRPEGAVRAKRRGIRCSPKKTWLPEEEEYLEEHWSVPGHIRPLKSTITAGRGRGFDEDPVLWRGDAIHRPCIDGL